MTTTQPALDTRQPRSGRKKDAADRTTSSVTESAPRPTTQPSSAAAKSAAKEARGPRTYLPGYYLG